MPLVVDLLPDSLVDRLKRFIRSKKSSSQLIQSQSPQNAHHQLGMGPHSLGFFNQASNFAVNNSVMVEVGNMWAVGTPASERLEPHTEPGAAVNSSARDPPPKCHPETRLNISSKLERWLDAVKGGGKWDMIWLHGPAYNSALTDQLTGDPQLLEKAPHVQLKKLIIDPLLLLQAHELTRIREPFMIILDGLDECEGERAQFNFINMINEAVQLKDLPLRWLICSRPEEHLQYTFSRIAYHDREELLLDDECRSDVDRYLRTELAGIKDEFRVIAPSPWPSEDQFNGLSGSVSGLFVFASTGIKYIGDPLYANPVDRLKKLLRFLNHIDAIGSNNPLASLDLLYIQILTDIPKDIFQTTWRILAHSIWVTKLIYGNKLYIVQNLCNFLHPDQSTFYSALRKLHSVIAVPAPEDASKAPLRFHHASFQDFLSNPNRSGEFVIQDKRAFVDIAKSCLFWHNIDVTHFHTNDRWYFDDEHQHASLPHLKWVSPDNEEDVSTLITDTTEECQEVFGGCADEKDNDLLLLIHDLDFRHMNAFGYFPGLANWVFQQYPSDPIVRTTPSNELDTRLLEYMRTVVGQGPVDPATFPVTDRGGVVPGGRRVYFFIGRAEKTIIIWITQCRGQWDIRTLTLDNEPSLQQIQEYQDWLVEINWNETSDGKEGEELED